MDDFTNPAELGLSSLTTPVLVIIEHNVLARTCILSILKREFAGYEIVEMPSTSGLNWLSGRDVRLIALNMEDKQITDPSIEDSLTLIADSFPNAYVALLSNRDDDATASIAMQTRSPRFFPDLDPGRGRNRGIAPCSCRWGLPAIADCRDAKSQGDIAICPCSRIIGNPPGQGRRQDFSREGDCRPDAPRTTGARGAGTRPPQQVDCRQAQPFGKHRENAYSTHHAKMFREQPHRGGPALERPAQR